MLGSEKRAITRWVELNRRNRYNEYDIDRVACAAIGDCHEHQQDNR
jgi:hypothetical protein